MKHSSKDEAENNTRNSLTIEHAKDGYHNAQDIIKFIDAKTGAVTGLVTLTIGGAWGIIAFYFDLNADARNIIASFAPIYIPGIFIGTSLLVGVIALAFSMLSLIARGPTADATVLFPYVPPDEESNRDYYWQLSQEMSQTQILNEYRIQVHTVGVILSKKIKWHRIAVWLLLVQLGVMALTPLSPIAYSCVRYMIATKSVSPTWVSPSLSASDTRSHPPPNAANNSTDPATAE